METIKEKTEKFSQSITLKALIIGFLTLIMLIPNAMIQDLISERKFRSIETINRINSKWSNSQTINGPVLVVPYQTRTIDEKKNILIKDHIYHLTPSVLDIHSKLTPEERHYGIYKSILYTSTLDFSGSFKPIGLLPPNSEIIWKNIGIRVGISDLRGITNNVNFMINGVQCEVETGGKDDFIGQGLFISLKNAEDVFRSGEPLQFAGDMTLRGSSDINFIPIAKTTHVQIEGDWKSPGFIGNFTPDYKINDNGFTASWNVLHFNRNIPDEWIDRDFSSSGETLYFGVNLVDTVNHYQLNMRSSKYALMFIALTFVVFFFVEILAKKKIHPIQYLLVGIALIIFYSLLLSISEQLNFAVAYLIASVATIGLIVVYTNSFLKSRAQTSILALLLCVLYTFLYVVLQLEDIALLIGSVGLFIILGIIMFVSRKIKWYKDGYQITESRQEGANK